MHLRTARAGERGRDRPARHDLRHRESVVGRCADIADRRGPGGGGACRRGDRLVVAVAADERPLGVGHAEDRGCERRDRDVRFGERAPVDRHDRGGPDDRDLHLSAVLEPHVGGPGARRQCGHRHRDEQLARLGDRRPRARPQVSIDTERSPAAERRITVASKHRSGPPVSIAGDAFITFPPIVPLARVACDPTIDAASASAVKRDRTTGLATSASCVTSAPRATPAPDSSMPRSASIRSMATIASGSGALPCPRPRRDPCRRRPASPGAERGDRLVDRRGGGEGSRHACTSRPAAQTRSGVMGIRRTCTPSTLAIALAIAAAVGTCGGSPTPSNHAAGVLRGDLDPIHLDLGASALVTSL